MRLAPVVPVEQRLKVKGTTGCRPTVLLMCLKLLQDHEVYYRVLNALISATMDLEIDVYGWPETLQIAKHF